MDRQSARVLTSAMLPLVLALGNGCTVSTSGGGGGGSADATIDFPATGDALLVITETGVGSASFFGTSDGAGDAVVITDMSVDSGDGLFDAEFDEAGRVRRIILPSGAEIGFSYHADGTFDYTLTSGGSERFSGSRVQPVDVVAFEAAAKAIRRLAVLPAAIQVCANETTERVAQSAYNLESADRPQPDPLVDVLSADAQFQDVAASYCVLRDVVEPDLREIATSFCPAAPASTTAELRCFRAVTALKHAGGFRTALLAVAIDMAKEALRDLTGDSLSGTVIGGVFDRDGGTPLSGATVRLTDVGLAATTDAQGQYGIFDVAAGTHTLVVTLDGFLDFSVSDVRVRPGGDVVELNIALVAEERAAETGTLAGVVFDLDGGASLSGATVRLTDVGLAATSDASGRYTIANVPAGTHTLVATLDGFMDFSLSNVDVRPGEAVTLDIALEADEPAAEEAIFTIVLHQNLNGDFGEGGAGAQVSVSGDASFPAFSWTVSQVVEVKVKRNQPPDFERLYGITMRSPGVDAVDVPTLPAPLTYGDHSIAGSSVLEGYPASAPPLERGVEYSVSVEPRVVPGRFIPSIVFVVEPR